MMNALESTSTRPYLVRALHEWCTDNGLTPYIAVLADDSVQVPREYVQNGEIVLNVSFDATSALKLDNELISFKARFGGVAREIMVPMDRVLAIYARENGQGMAFPVAVPTADTEGEDGVASVESGEAPADEPAPAARAGMQLVQPADDGVGSDEKPDTDPPPPAPSKRKRPALKVVK